MQSRHFLRVILGSCWDTFPERPANLILCNPERAQRFPYLFAECCALWVLRNDIYVVEHIIICDQAPKVIGTDFSLWAPACGSPTRCGWLETYFPVTYAGSPCWCWFWYTAHVELSRYLSLEPMFIKLSTALISLHRAYIPFFSYIWYASHIACLTYVSTFRVAF